jgi:DNA-binding SARP family transcriptional activator
MAPALDPPTLRAGLSALAKSALLLLGVPAVLARLWILASPPDQPFDLRASVVAHVVLLGVGLGWLAAGTALVRDLVGALARKPLDASTWSHRWALRLAALLLMIGAASAAGATGRSGQPPRPASTATLPAALSATRRSSIGLSAPEMAAAAGLGALAAAGLARRARALRRASAALRRAGERLPNPSLPAALLETALGPASETLMLEWIDGANRLLWRSLQGAAPGTPVPPIVLVRAGPDGVELRLERPCPRALDGFEVLEGGTWWCLDPEVDLSELAHRTRGCGRLLPALVPIGEDGTATYLLNVSPDRRLVLTGNPTRARKALEGILLALRCLPWADELSVELLGMRAPRAHERCYQLSASSVAELRALSSGPPFDPHARLAATWSRQPLVVSALASSLEHEALLASCQGRAGVVSLGGRGELELAFDETGAWLEPLGLRVFPACPSREQLELADRLLEEAAASATQPDEHVGEASALAREESTRFQGLEQPGTVELRLLDGPPRLEGVSLDAVTPRDAARVVELVTYLCLARRPASALELCEVLFPHARTQQVERLERLLAAGRTLLGLAHDGSPLLARQPEGAVALPPELTCDATRLEAAATAARAAAPELAESWLRDALGLVGTGPCCPEIGPSWWMTSGARESVIATVVDAAHHLALLALARNDSSLARWAVERGRQAEPHAELLARDLLLACDADGDLSGATRAFQELEEGLARLGGNEPSEETRELFMTLTQKR